MHKRGSPDGQGDISIWVSDCGGFHSSLVVAYIALIGLPGSGKSTIGRQLARRLSLPFLDTDAVIEARIHCSINEYFERSGEHAFREVEEAVISELDVAGSGVVATGGGAVLRESNRLRLRSCAHVIYLRSSPEEVYRRLRGDSSRPLLQVSDPLKRLRRLYAERDPLYRQTAHFTVETGRPSAQTLVNMIQMQLELAGVLGQTSVGHS
ncbi:MAG: shikimate kinase [Ramlibacter sp.]|nr:shikimate kinase [Ramlibacter sp.]